MVWDVIVVGVGGMGSAACWQLARRGQRVLGLERFDIPHSMGSSHGISRIIRLPYYEDPAYVPLLHRAYELWAEAERATGATLLVTTGSVDGGPEDDPLFQGALASTRLHGLAHEVLTGTAVNERFPGYRMDPAARFVFQRQGGLIASERAIVAHANAAMAEGATIRARERVLDWEAHPSGEGVTVRTDKASYRAARLVLTAGPWMADLVPLLSGGGGAGTPGADLDAAAPARAVHARPLPGVQPAGGGRPLLRLPSLRGPGLQVRPLPSPGRDHAGGGDAPRG